MYGVDTNDIAQSNILFKAIGIIQGSTNYEDVSCCRGAGLILAHSFFALATCTGLTLRAGGQKKGPP